MYSTRELLGLLGVLLGLNHTNNSKESTQNLRGSLNTGTSTGAEGDILFIIRVHKVFTIKNIYKHYFATERSGGLFQKLYATSSNRYCDELLF